MWNVQNTAQATSEMNAKVRTVEMSKYDDINEQSMFESFDEHTITTGDNGFDIVAKKNFDVSLFAELDEVSANVDGEIVTVRYDITYEDSETAILLTVTIEGSEDLPLVETIPGLVTKNSAGNADVMLVLEEGEFMWLSDLQELDTIDNVGLFSKLLKKVSKIVNQVTETVKKAVNVVCETVVAIATVLKPVIRLGSDISVKLLGRTSADIGAFFLNMTPEVDANGNRTGIYHAHFDCWQSIFGYTAVYDRVFNAVTNMRTKQFPFDTNGDGRDDYILWAWKGDYLNLGAGAELGIYKSWKYDINIWQVDKSEAMKMTLKLDYYGTTIIDWAPEQKQWWITGFNYNYQSPNINKLTATYTITFDDKNMMNAFVSKSENKNAWKFTDNMTFEYVL